MKQKSERKGQIATTNKKNLKVQEKKEYYAYPLIYIYTRMNYSIAEIAELMEIPYQKLQYQLKSESIKLSRLIEIASKINISLSFTLEPKDEATAQMKFSKGKIKGTIPEYKKNGNYPEWFIAATSKSNILKPILEAIIMSGQTITSIRENIYNGILQAGTFQNMIQKDDMPLNVAVRLAELLDMDLTWNIKKIDEKSYNSSGDTGSL